MRLSKNLIDPIVIIALIVGWVLLLLPTLTPPAKGRLSLARVRALNEDYEVRFGILGISGGSDRDSSRRPGYDSSLGYSAALSLPMRLRSPWADVDDNDRFGRRSFTVLRQDDTEGLLLWPVALAVLGIAFLSFIPGAMTSSGGWLGLSAFFAVLGALFSWTAWGLAMSLTSKIESGLQYYRGNPDRQWDLTIERGNVIWPGLVGSLLVTNAAVLTFIRVATRPHKEKDGDRGERQEMTPLAHKEHDRHLSVSSTETLTNP